MSKVTVLSRLSTNVLADATQCRRTVAGWFRYHLTPRSQQMLSGPPSADRLSFQFVWSYGC